MSSLGSLVVSLTANTAEFTKDLGKAAHEAELRMKSIADAADKAGKIVEGAFIAAVGSISLLVRHAVETADAMLKMSQSAGVSVQAFSELSFAAKLSDVDTQTFATSLERLSKSMAQSAMGNEQAAQAYAVLGLNVKNADGTLKSADQMLLEIADKFAGMADGATKTALAMAIFSRGGAVMIPMLNQGSVALREMRQEARELGVSMDTTTAQAAERFHDQIKRLETVVAGLGNAIMIELLPQMNELADNMVDTAKKTDLFSTAASAATILWQTFAVVSANVAYVFKAIGTEIGGIAAQLDLIGRRDFFGAFRIHEEMKKDADAARKDLDALEEHIMNFGKNRPTIQIDPFIKSPEKKQAPELTDLGAAKKEAAARMEFLKAQATTELAMYKEGLANKQTLLTLAYEDNRVSDADYFAGKLQNAKDAAAKEKQITDGLLDQQYANLAKQKQGTAEYWKAVKEVNETVAKGNKITVDLGMASLVGFEQAKKAAEHYKRSIEEINVQILQMRGQTAAAAAQQSELQNRDLRKKAVTAGDKSGVADIDELGRLTRTQALFNEQREKLGRIDAALATQEGLIYAQVRMGQISTLEGANQIAAARAESIPDQQAVIALMGQLAEASGNATLRLQAQQAATALMTAGVRDAGFAVAESVMSVQDLEIASYQQRIVALKAFIATYGVSAKAGQVLMERLEIQHEAKMGNISSIGAVERRQFSELNAKEQTQSILGYLTTLSAGAAQKNRAMFELNKIGSIANAIIYTYEGANKALSLGPWGIPIAAAIVAAGLANVATIASTTFGSSAPSGGGGSGAIPTTDVPNAGAPQGTGPGMTTIIELHGESFSRKQIRELFAKMSENGRDGGRVVLA